MARKTSDLSSWLGHVTGSARLLALDGGGGSAWTGERGGGQGGEQNGWQGTPPSRPIGKYNVKKRGRHGEGEAGVIQF